MTKNIRRFGWMLMLASVLAGCDKKSAEPPEPIANNAATDYVNGLENSQREATAAAALASRKENQVNQKTQDATDSN